MNSTSVSTPERRHSAAKKKTVRIPLAAMFHHSQFPAIPFCATNPVTASGVSTANVVATIEVPVSHHGALRPERKYSPMFFPLPRANHSPIPRLIAKNATMTAMSRGLSAMAVRSCAAPRSPLRAADHGVGACERAGRDVLQAAVCDQRVVVALFALEAREPVAPERIGCGLQRGRRLGGERIVRVQRVAHRLGDAHVTDLMMVDRSAQRFGAFAIGRRHVR